MYPMIACPVENGSLVGDGISKHEEETDRKGGGVGSVGPETVHTYSYTEATDWPEYESPHQRLLTTLHDLREPEKTNYVHKTDVDAHGPIDRPCVPVMLDQRRDFANHFERAVHGS
eukprot:1009074_1